MRLEKNRRRSWDSHHSPHERKEGRKHEYNSVYKSVSPLTFEINGSQNWCGIEGDEMRWNVRCHKWCSNLCVPLLLWLCYGSILDLGLCRLPCLCLTYGNMGKRKERKEDWGWWSEEWNCGITACFVPIQLTVNSYDWLNEFELGVNWFGKFPFVALGAHFFNEFAEAYSVNGRKGEDWFCMYFIFAVLRSW